MRMGITFKDLVNTRTEQLKIVHSNEQNQVSVGQYKQLNIYVNGVPKGEDRKLGIKIHKK